MPIQPRLSFALQDATILSWYRNVTPEEKGIILSTKDAIAKTRKGMGRLAKEAPEFMQHFSSMVQAVEKSGVLDAKTTELILVGLAVGKQCSYCIELHVELALKAGATREEILAAAELAVVMGGGPALMYAVNSVIDALDDLTD